MATSFHLGQSFYKFGTDTPQLLSTYPHTNKMSIQKIEARMIIDSRGNPTVEVDLHTEKGLFSTLR